MRARNAEPAGASAPRGGPGTEPAAGAYPRRRTHYLPFAVLALGWTLIVAVEIYQDSRREEQLQYDVVLSGAREVFMRDVVYRDWATRHGGVYVNVDSGTEPNPYLAKIKERDITTPSGRKLTLMNPAYMNRQVFEMGFQKFGMRSHITSLKPIRPENAPDDWERAALGQFEGGKKEVSSLSPIGGASYLRFMAPLVAEQGCLACHADQGYKVGDIRGGISVALPWETSRRSLDEHFRSNLRGMFFIWLLGVFGILLGAVRIDRIQRRLHQSGEKLAATAAENQRLLSELQHRAKNSFNMISGLVNFTAMSQASPETRAAFEGLEARVSAVSELYSHLYATGSTEDTDLGAYCLKVADTLIGLSDTIILVTDLEAVAAPVKVAAPVGLIVAELLTNAMKYAFPEGRKGRIFLVLKRSARGAFLEVADDGAGLPGDFEERSGTGLLLLRGLAEQVGG